jgi:hypothetical protein
MLKLQTRYYLLVFILLFFSGNPLAGFLFGKFAANVGLLVVAAIIGYKQILPKLFVNKYTCISVVIALLFVFQKGTLGFVSVPGAINLLLKIFLGGIVIYHLKEKFAPVLFEVLYKLSIVSLLFFCLINLLRIQLPYLSITDEIHSYILYGTSFELHWYKNPGMFWEPGAHAGILTLGLALNFDRFAYLWRHERIKLLTIIITLLTTQSTTGYLVGFIILTLYVLSMKRKGIALLLLPCLLFIGMWVYTNTDFLSSKIEEQYEKTTEQGIGELSNSRFGSIIFDWHYVQKHPFIGNGLHEKTRYADHQYLFIGEKGDIIGSGNGFSNFLASMGLFFIVGYFYLIWKVAKNKGTKFALLLLLTVLLKLQ